MNYLACLFLTFLFALKLFAASCIGISVFIAWQEPLFMESSLDR